MEPLGKQPWPEAKRHIDGKLGFCDSFAGTTVLKLACAPYTEAESPAPNPFPKERIMAEC